MAITKITNNSLSSSAAIARDKLADTLAVCSYSNTSNGGFVVNTWEGIPFDTEVVDTNSAYAEEATDNNNAGVFTVPTTGKYLIIVNQIANCTDTNRLTAAYIRLVLNTTGDATNGGTEIIGTKSGTLIPDSSLATEIAMTTSCIQSFSTGNKIWAQFYGNVGAGALRAGDGNFSVMQID